jgi:predicted nuclease of restriction endonuclease-like RecB superfamily
MCHVRHELAQPIQIEQNAKTTQLTSTIPTKGPASILDQTDTSGVQLTKLAPSVTPSAPSDTES